ncbi:MAG: ferritin-like domain-containing protein [Chloroflexi bacterium]|nr:ferritin-like domain-containing protein [Chloroflexota bacterium]
MAIRTPQELFLHDLSAAFYSENAILKAMNEMLAMAQSARVKQMLEDHINESQTQVKNIEQCFAELGQRPQPVKCFVTDGLIEDFKVLVRDIKDPKLIDLCILGAMDKTEHLETATYRSLITKAQLLGHTNVSQILRKVVSGEEKEAKLVESAEHDIGKQLIGKIPPAGPATHPRAGI